jgi:cytochrome b subunit of formate dehydrogenase
MFQWISFAALGLVIGGALVHHLAFPYGGENRFAPAALVRWKERLLTLLPLRRDLTWIGRLVRLAFLLALLSFAVLLLTGFGPPLLGGQLTGWLLMLHVTFAPVLIVCMAFLVLVRAHRMAFDGGDLQTLRRLPSRRSCGGRSCPLTDEPLGSKCCFWLLAGLSLPVALSAILSMFPFFGTEGQAFLHQLHRWSALLFACTAIADLYILIRQQVRKEFETSN